MREQFTEAGPTRAEWVLAIVGASDMSGRVSAVSGGDWASTGSDRVVRRVGVDARALRLQCTGVERMTTHFIRNLGRVAPRQEFVLFVDQPVERPAWLSPSCQMVVEPVR